MSWSKAFALLLVALTLAACGFEPVYGTRHGETSSELSKIEVAIIQERVGQLLRNHLLDTLTPYGEPKKPAYRLEVDLNEGKEELAVRKTELATRANLNLAANYRLYLIGAEESQIGTGKPLLARTSAVAASYNFLDNDYANLSSEADARERGTRELSEDIARQLAIYFNARAKGLAR